MSRVRALKAMNLEFTDKIPCMEWLDNPEFVKQLTGIDPFVNPSAGVIEAIKKLDIDWYIRIPQKAYRFNDGETKKAIDDGNYVTEWGFTGSFWEKETEFLTEDEVFQYNPLEDLQGKVRIVSREYRQESIDVAIEGQKLAGESTLVTGLYYTMLFQCFIMAYGWELFLITAASEPEKFKNCIELFTQFSIMNTKEWAKTDIPVFFCHDDLAVSRGLVFPPEWYRENILPNYERILEPIKKSGKKIIFVSDGNYSELIDDIFSVGVDGIMVDNYVEIEPILKKYGSRKVIVGNASTQVLTEGNFEDIYKEVKRCSDLGKQYPGYFFKASGDLPHNIPANNIKHYFDVCNILGRR